MNLLAFLTHKTLSQHPAQNHTNTTRQEKKEELIHNIGNKQMNYLEYEPQIRHLTGYEGALCDAIYCIEEDYKVGPRHILNPNPNLE